MEGCSAYDRIIRRFRPPEKGGTKMLISDLRVIGNNLLAVRKKLGMTQMEVAEAAGLADRPMRTSSAAA